MFTRFLFFAAIGLVLPAAGDEHSVREVAPTATENAPPQLPGSPAELYSALAKNTRPQWRPLFRDTVRRSADDRYKAALALGAVCADAYLAAEVRDAQQVRNLLNDMSSLEMMLSLARQMSSLRQKLTAVADAGDWPGVRAEIATIMAMHAQLLGEQKDEHLAELERIGCWLRAFHVGIRFAVRQHPELPNFPGWSGDLMADLHTRAAKVNAHNNSKTLQFLVAGLESLDKTWAGETTAANAADRVAASGKLLDSMMADLISDESAEPQAPKSRP
jgi:hypothetical protein